MAIDKLQLKIRKMKSPLVVDFSMLREHIPQQYWGVEGDYISAYISYVMSLLDALKSDVPAVRFNFSMLALYGNCGIDALIKLLKAAKMHGYYVFLDVPDSLSMQSAKCAAELLLAEETQWEFDGLIVSSYIGSDGIAPYTSCLKKSDKDLFVVTRTSNRSAAEMQDLLTGSRLAHIAMADIVYRHASSFVERCGYSRVGLVAAASSADSLRILRGKYKDMFLLLDGSDYPNANAKNCSNAFDKLGHGAIACIGLSVTAAWMADNDNAPTEAAASAVGRMKKNIARYVTIL
jgi:orotidine-5'-phosphate decarboxylase